MGIMGTEECIKGLEDLLYNCNELMGEHPSCEKGWSYTELVIIEAIEKLKVMKRIEDEIRDGTF